MTYFQNIPELRSYLDSWPKFPFWDGFSGEETGLSLQILVIKEPIANRTVHLLLPSLETGRVPHVSRFSRRGCSQCRNLMGRPHGSRDSHRRSSRPRRLVVTFL